MPRCPLCHNKTEKLKGILFHDSELTIYIDGIRYSLTGLEYRIVKTLYDHGRPMLPWLLEAQLYGTCDGSKQASIRSAICKARDKLLGSRLFIPLRKGGGGTAQDSGYRVVEFPL